jgi:hypothetical protein
VMYPILFCVFLGQFCDVPKVAIIHVCEDLDRFGYKLNMKLIFLKHQVYVFGYLLEPCVNIWRFFFQILNWILAIENSPQKNLI